MVAAGLRGCVVNMLEHDEVVRDVASTAYAWPQEHNTLCGWGRQRRRSQQMLISVEARMHGQYRGACRQPSFHRKRFCGRRCTPGDLASQQSVTSRRGRMEFLKGLHTSSIASCDEAGSSCVCMLSPGQRSLCRNPNRSADPDTGRCRQQMPWMYVIMCL